MLEAIGKAVAPWSLPLAYAQWDLRSRAGWKARIEAAERLARVGALPAPALMSTYATRRPAASGGVWERVSAMQAVTDALDTAAPRALARALPRAWSEMAAAGLLVPFAEVHGAAIAAQRPGRDAGPLAFRLGLLSPEYETVAQAASAQTTDPDLRVLIDLARGLPATPPPGASATMTAITSAFTETLPPARGEWARLSDTDRRGEALLQALAIVARGAEADPATLGPALAHLRRLGCEETARRAALEILILGDTG